MKDYWELNAEFVLAHQEPELSEGEILGLGCLGILVLSFLFLGFLGFLGLALS